MNECDTAGCDLLLIKILIVILAWVLMAASDGAEIGFCEVPKTTASRILVFYTVQSWCSLFLDHGTYCSCVSPRFWLRYDQSCHALQVVWQTPSFWDWVRLSFLRCDFGSTWDVRIPSFLLYRQASIECALSELYSSSV